MYKILIAGALALLIPFFSFSQNVAWRRATAGVVEFGLAADSFQHLRFLTSFSGMYDFDPGPGESILEVQGPKRFVLQSYRNDGTFRWARLHGGPNIDSTSALLGLDPSGNAFVVGLFSQTADFDPGPGEYLLTAIGASDYYMAKYDTLGVLVWVRQLSGAIRLDGEVNAPHFDRDGNILLGISLTAATDLDPGPATQTVAPLGQWDAVVLKLDPDFNYLWSARVGGSGFDQARSIRTDAQNNVYLYGSMGGNGDYDPGPDTFLLTKGSGTDDAFILKLNPDGQFIWARQLRCTQSSGKVYPIGVAVDAAGNSYTTGYYLTRVDFDPGPAVLLKTAEGANDIFAVKLDPAGNLVYANSIGDALETGTGIAVDREGSAYLTGYFTSILDVDPGPDTILCTPEFGSYDGFVLKYDAAGKYQWVRRFGGPENDTGYELTVDNDLNVYFINRMTEVYNLGYAEGEDFVPVNAVERVMLMQIDQRNNYHGSIYRDLNNNQIRDPQEPGLPNVVVEVNGQTLFATTRNDGRYSLYHDLHADTVRPLAHQPYWTITPPFAVADSLNPAMDFAVTFPPDYRDVSVKTFALDRFNPGFHTDLKILVKNLSSESVDSVPVTLSGLNLTPPFSFQSALPLPDAVHADHLLWYTDTLLPGEETAINVRLKLEVGAALGTPVHLTATVFYPNDANPGDDTAHIVSAVNGSFDPNDKLVFPAELSVQDLDTARLYYLIRFQNTGTAPARFVILRDTLSAALDPASLQVLGASHAFTWRLHEQGVFEVRFDDINLPDSTSDLAGSQGFVAFSLRPDRDLTIGDTVYNRAGIYFDYNEPVMTPWAKAAIVLPSVSVHEPYASAGALTIYPNPAKQQCTVGSRGKLSGPGFVQLFDTFGKLHRSVPVTDAGLPIVLTDLPATGVYVVQVITKNGLMSGLLAIQN